MLFCVSITHQLMDKNVCFWVLKFRFFQPLPLTHIRSSQHASTCSFMLVLKSLGQFWKSVFSFLKSSVTLPDCLTSPLFDHQGRVECWDPRVRNRVGMLDCALSSLTEGEEYVPSCHIEMSNGFQLMSACRCLCSHMALLSTAWKTSCKLYIIMLHCYTAFIWRTVSYPVTVCTIISSFLSLCSLYLLTPSYSVDLMLFLFVFLLTEFKGCPQLALWSLMAPSPWQ